MITQRQVLKAQHRPLALERCWVDDQLLYQSICWCGRRGLVGSRRDTQKDQKTHRREILREMNREAQELAGADSL